MNVLFYTWHLYLLVFLEGEYRAEGLKCDSMPINKGTSKSMY